MKFKVMIMALLLLVGIGSAANRLPATEFSGDVNTSTYNVTGDAFVRPAMISIMGDGTDVIAVYRNGTVLLKSASFDTVFDAAIAELPEIGASLTIVGRDDGGQYQNTSKHTISSKNDLSIDARSAKFKAATDVTPFHFYDVDYSEIILGHIDGTGQTGNGVLLEECDVTSVKLVHIQYFDNGIAIIDNSTQNSLDNDIYFQYISQCNDGIYIETYDAQGLRVRGNFINYCYNTSIRIRGMDSLALNWNDIEVLALEGAGVTPYGVYITGGGYGNTMKIPAFLGGYTVRNLYDTMGGWFYTLPNRHTTLGTAVSSKSVGVMSYDDRFVIDGSLQVSGAITEVGKLNTVFHTINAVNYTELTTYNCALSDNGDGTFRLTSTGDSPYISLSNINVPGSISQYVYIKARAVQTGTTAARAFYYTTSGHGFSPSYYKAWVGIDSSDWTIRRLDMHDLTAGEDDWKNNNILGWRADFGGTHPVVYDIAYIVMVSETAPGLN